MAGNFKQAGAYLPRNSCNLGGALEKLLIMLFIRTVWISRQYFCPSCLCVCWNIVKITGKLQSSSIAKVVNELIKGYVLQLGLFNAQRNHRWGNHFHSLLDELGL